MNYKPWFNSLVHSGRACINGPNFCLSSSSSVKYLQVISNQFKCRICQHSSIQLHCCPEKCFTQSISVFSNSVKHCKHTPSDHISAQYLELYILGGNLFSLLLTDFLFSSFSLNSNFLSSTDLYSVYSNVCKCTKHLLVYPVPICTLNQ